MHIRHPIPCSPSYRCILTPFKLRKLKKKLSTAWWGKNSKKIEKKLSVQLVEENSFIFLKRKWKKMSVQLFLDICRNASESHLSLQLLLFCKCNSLQLTATHCNSLQLTETHCNRLAQFFSKCPQAHKLL